MDKDELEIFISELLADFQKKRLESLSKIKLKKILKRKNPYLYKAKNILTAEQLIRSILDAHLSSQEETIFGEVLERLAIFVCDKTFKGAKSAAEGIDLEFQKENVRFLVIIKSGPNWGNSQQIKRMRSNFLQALRVLRTNHPELNIRAINGCCYGKIKGNQQDKGDYIKICGQAFWELISNNENLYLDIIKPFEKVAYAKEELFIETYASVINKFTKELLDTFCLKDGAIDWQKLIIHNSGKIK